LMKRPIFWIDTHCHLDAPALSGAGDALRAQAAHAGVGHMVIPAVARANWEAVIALAHRHGDSYALGIHPLYTPQACAQDIAALRELLVQRRDDPHLVAVGEIGLDFFVPGLDAPRQRWFFQQQLALARALDLPVIVHVRKGVDAVLHMLRACPVAGGIAHAFNGSAQQAHAFIGLGFKLGFGGAVTYTRAHKLRALARCLPLDALVLETDAPDMPPQWLYVSAAQRAAGQEQRRNTPAELARIAPQLAHLRGMAPAALALATCRNARAALRGLPCLLQTSEP